MTVLRIESAITATASASRELYSAFVAKLTEKTPGAAIVYRDLADEPLTH